ncbi:MAG: hypothetical protein JSV00_03150 [bacterium]|nr:MAG: hypothetical protein JSV00_03150 [bacterium]
MAASDDRRRRVAFHEAGHAFMMVRRGLGILSATIETSHAAPGDTRGLTLPSTVLEENQPELSDRFAACALAGSAAEHYLMGSWDEEILQARAHDTGRAKSYLVMSGREYRPEALDFIIQSMANTVLDEIAAHRAWHAVTVLAYALLEKGTLTGKEVMDVLGEEP